MKQHGALFTTENRLAIREDRKTKTRRCGAELAHVNECPDEWQPLLSSDKFKDLITLLQNQRTGEIVPIYPRWAVGDELYIKEPHYLYGRWEQIFDQKHSKYSWLFHYNKSDGVRFPPTHHPPVLKVCASKFEVGWFLRSPLFMPKWAARDWLRVTAVRCERLQSISEIDALNEGIDTEGEEYNRAEHAQLGGVPLEYAPSVYAYANLWDSINGKKHPWERNEWVLAYTFERIKK